MINGVERRELWIEDLAVIEMSQIENKVLAVEKIKNQRFMKN